MNDDHGSAILRIPWELLLVLLYRNWIFLVRRMNINYAGSVALDKHETTLTMKCTRFKKGLGYKYNQRMN